MRDSDTWRCVVRRHDTDVTSLVFGLIFVGVAGLWLLGQSDVMDLPDLSVLGPALLVVAGFIGLAATLGKSNKPRRVPASQPAMYSEPAAYSEPSTELFPEPEPDPV